MRLWDIIVQETVAHEIRVTRERVWRASPVPGRGRPGAVGRWTRGEKSVARISTVAMPWCSKRLPAAKSRGEAQPVAWWNAGEAQPIAKSERRERAKSELACWWHAPILLRKRLEQ